MTDEAYQGRCPRCSNQLVVDGGLLRCPSKHFTINREKFENAWEAWNESPKDLFHTHMLLDALLEDDLEEPDEKQ